MMWGVCNSFGELEATQMISMMVDANSDSVVPIGSSHYDHEDGDGNPDVLDAMPSYSRIPEEKIGLFQYGTTCMVPAYLHGRNCGQECF
jgi:hypothetical protein